MNLAIIFPGQGSQKVGMGLDLSEISTAKEIFTKVNAITTKNISEVFLHGPQEELNQTKNTQISIIAISVTLTLLLQEELKSKNISFIPKACCGHSLGELTALWFANLLELEELIRLVSIRGNLMQNAPSGSMAAIINLKAEQVENLIKNDSSLKDKVVIANYNSPNQLVISGHKEAFTNSNLIEKIKSLGGKAIILPVGGAFHSPLMEEPAELFSEEIDKVFALKSTNINIPIYQNFDGEPSTNIENIKIKIKKQMISPVYWTQTINNLVKNHITGIVEIGPGKVLTGLVQKINPNILCYNIYDLNSLRSFVTQYESQLSTIKHSQAT